MRLEFVIFNLLSVYLKCNAHVPVISEVLMGARQKIQMDIGNVANTFAQTLTHGLNFNLGGHVNFNQQRPEYQHRPPPLSNNRGPEGKPNDCDIALVIVEENSNQNNYEPQKPNRFGPPPPPPPPHTYRPHDPNFNGPQDNGYIHHHHHHHHHHHYNHENRPNYSGQNEPADHNQNQHNQNNYESSSENNYGNSNHDSFKTTKQSKSTTEQTLEMSTSSKPNDHEPTPMTLPGTSNYDMIINPETTTKKPVDDQPLFVPLNPDQYTYGGDKINITAPKRDATDKDKPAESEEEFPIDIRFQDQ